MIRPFSLLLALSACSVQPAADPAPGVSVDPTATAVPDPRVPATPPTSTPFVTGEWTPLPIGPRALLDATAITGSSSIAVHPTLHRLYAANRDAGTISYAPNDGSGNNVAMVGAEPERLAIAGDRIFVTLRGSRSIAALDTDLNVQQVVELGAEPVAVTAREDGQRIYVALSQENAVAILNAEDLTQLARIAIPGEPRYLALHPSGGSLYVGSGRGQAQLTRVDLQTLDKTLIALPKTQTTSQLVEPFTDDLDGIDVFDMVPRITGDLAVNPAGTALLVPTLYADTETPIPDMSNLDDLDELDLEPGPFGGASDGGYGGGKTKTGRVNPAIVDIPLDETGVPAGEGIAYNIGSAADPFLADAMGLGLGGASSYITHVQPAPSGHRWLVSMEAAGVAMLVDADAPIDPLLLDELGSFLPEPGLPLHVAGFVPVLGATLQSGVGIQTAAFAGDQRILVHNRLSDEVVSYQRVEVDSILNEIVLSGMDFVGPVPMHTSLQSSEPTLPDDVLEGRLAFYSATDLRMGAGGVSCSTCHFEGRNDGLTWQFEGGIRQTPSLAGVVSETAPVTWSSEVESVGLEAMLTTMGRMGGEGPDTTMLSNLEAFVDWSPIPDVPTMDAAAVDRGEQLFSRADVGCLACHSGARGTDNLQHTVRGISANTPTLTGIAATAPYFHNGSAATLRAVLEDSRNGSMGNTGSLTDAEMDDLEAYIKAL